MSKIGEDVIDELKMSLLTPKKSSGKIQEVEPEEEPIDEDP